MDKLFRIRGEIDIKKVLIVGILGSLGVVGYLKCQQDKDRNPIPGQGVTPIPNPIEKLFRTTYKQKYKTIVEKATGNPYRIFYNDPTTNKEKEAIVYSPPENPSSLCFLFNKKFHKDALLLPFSADCLVDKTGDDFTLDDEVTTGEKSASERIYIPTVLKASELHPSKQKHIRESVKRIIEKTYDRLKDHSSLHKSLDQQLESTSSYARKTYFRPVYRSKKKKKCLIEAIRSKFPNGTYVDRYFANHYEGNLIFDGTASFYQLNGTDVITAGNANYYPKKNGESRYVTLKSWPLDKENMIDRLEYMSKVLILKQLFTQH